MDNRINVYICGFGHKTVTKDVDEGTTPMIMDCSVDGCIGHARSSWYQTDQNQEHTHEWYKPANINKVPKHSREHVQMGGLMLRKIGEVKSDMHEKPFSERVKQAFINKKKSK